MIMLMMDDGKDIDGDDYDDNNEVEMNEYDYDDIYDDANDVHFDGDVLMYVDNENVYDGDDINVNDHDSCESNFGSLFIVVAPKLP